MLSFAVLVVLGSGADAALPDPPVLEQDPIDLGSVVIVDGTDQATPLASGGSNTVFTMLPPDGATCPGDSANDQWRLQSFMIPIEDDPASVDYGVSGPEAAGQYVVWQTDTTGFVDESLFENEAPGRPGRLPEPPRLTFATYLPDSIEMGRYRIGYACTYFRQTAQFWDTEIELVADTSDYPAQFRWNVLETVDGAVDVESSSGRRRNDVLFIGGSVAVLAGGGLYMWIRIAENRRRDDQPSRADSRDDHNELVKEPS